MTVRCSSIPIRPSRPAGAKGKDADTNVRGGRYSKRNQPLRGSLLQAILHICVSSFPWGAKVSLLHRPTGSYRQLMVKREAIGGWHTFRRTFSHLALALGLPEVAPGGWDPNVLG